MAIDTTSGVNLNDVLAASGVSTGTTKKTATDTTSQTGNSTLGKDAFLQLLVTQMQHQNPLDPQDNGEFVAQLAQFSSLEGITSLNESVTNITSAMASSQALQASSLVGRSVIVQNDKAVVDTAESFNGQFVVPQAIDGAKITVRTRTATPSRPSKWVSRKPAMPTSSGMAPTRAARRSTRVPTPSRPAPRWTASRCR